MYAESLNPRYRSSYDWHPLSKQRSARFLKIILYEKVVALQYIII